MFRQWLIVVLALALTFSTQVVLAAKPSGNPGGGPKGGQAAEPKERVHSKQAIMRTAVVLKAAQKAAAASGVSTGLGLAVGHQQYAMALHKQGQYAKALYHTLRARALAAAVIERSKAARPVEVSLTTEEVVYRNLMPKDSELDSELRVKIAIPTDFGALKLELVLNLD